VHRAGNDAHAAGLGVRARHPDLDHTGTLEGARERLQLTAVRGVDPRAFTVRRAYLPVRGNWILRFSARRGSDRYAGSLAHLVR
jgi:hypothetical protein